MFFFNWQGGASLNPGISLGLAKVYNPKQDEGHCDNYKVSIEGRLGQTDMLELTMVNNIY